MPAFPNTVAYNDRPTGDDVVRIEVAQPDNPFLQGVIDQGEDPLWWLKGSARWQAERRGIDIEAIVRVVHNPEQILAIREGREVRQSRMPDGRYLLRIIVETSDASLTVVTMYRTSKIDKYWTP